MVNIELAFDLNSFPRKNEPNDEKIHGRLLMMLSTLAPVTYVPSHYFPNPCHRHPERLIHEYHRPANIIYGRWISFSDYVGKETSGKYFILLQESMYDPEGLVVNPSACFFDSRSEEFPFLTLYGLSPKLDTGGVDALGSYGELEYWYTPNELMVHQSVKWSATPF